MHLEHPHFTLKVNGHFDAELLGPVHCTIEPGPWNRIKFEVEITTYDLDTDGYVIDNREVTQYFKDIKSVDISCERLAQKAAADFYKSMKNRGLTCARVLVKLYGADHASVEYVLQGSCQT